MKKPETQYNYHMSKLLDSEDVFEPTLLKPEVKPFVSPLQPSPAFSAFSTASQSLPPIKF